MSRTRRGFTLVELLVVMGIMLVLIALLMPMVGRAVEHANAARCNANVHTLAQGMLAFATEHDNHLPGSKNSYLYYYVDANVDHFDWLFGKFSNYDLFGFTIVDRLAFAPQEGTLFKYVGGNYKTYLCPSLTPEKPSSGIGSNGRFDYAALSMFCGADVRQINTVCQLHYPMDPANPNLVTNTSGHPGYDVRFDSHWSTKVEDKPTPIIVQEESSMYINSNLEGQHAGPDEISHCHLGGSYYGAVDGSTNWIVEPDTDPNNMGLEGAYLWTLNGPRSKSPVTLNGDPGQWNAWAHY